MDILGASASANADLKIDKDNKGKILRLALDECIRKMLPDIDSGLAKVSAATPAKTLDTPKTVETPKSGDTPVTPPVAAKKFCGQCGREMGSAAKFCSSCGAKAE